MTRFARITFLSDFGWSGGYVAACEAAIARVCPETRVYHVSHELAPGDVAAGALALARIAPLFPTAVHLAVVDPGVGTVRHPLALSTTRGHALVGPDNGLLMAAAEALGGIGEAWLLDAQQVRAAAGLPIEEVSFTFHGRDIFAPAAALLAAGNTLSALGSTLDPRDLVRLPAPELQSGADDLVAEIIEVDRFGNVELAVPFADFHLKGSSFLVEIVGEDLPVWNARLVHAFADLPPGELGILCDSWGHVALAFNSASAGQLLSVDRSMKIRISIPEASASNISPE